MVKKRERIDSIDALRGFDMLMIIFADQFFYHLNEGVSNDITSFFATQFSHPSWFGFHFYDIIMPLFLFLVGVVIPYSLDNRLSSNTISLKSIYYHIIRRFVILFVLGWVVQGNLLAFDSSTFKIYSNTLQAIAVGYLFSSIAYIHLGRKARYASFVLCLLVYALALELVPVPGYGAGRILPDENLAIYLDRLILGRYEDGFQYTWLLSGLGFVATTLSGLFAGELIKTIKKPKRILKNLVLYGLFLVIIGAVLSLVHPFVKKIWTSSFVLVTSGICTLLLAAFYWIIDIKKYKGWIFPLKVVGANAIVAYVLSHIISFPAIADQLLYGFKQFSENYYNSITVVGGFAILYFVLWYMHKNNTIIKI